MQNSSQQDTSAARQIKIAIDAPREAPTLEHRGTVSPPGSLIGAGRGSLENGCHSSDFRSGARSFDHRARRIVDVTGTDLIHLKGLPGDARYSQISINRYGDDHERALQSPARLGHPDRAAFRAFVPVAHAGFFSRQRKLPRGNAGQVSRQRPVPRLPLG